MITKAEHDAAEAEEVQVYPVDDVFREFAPFFVEQVRRDVVDRYGNPALLQDGLRVDTTMDSEKQRAAQAAMLDGCSQVDKRQGFRGPVLTPRGRPSSGRRFVDRSAEGPRGREPIEPAATTWASSTGVDDDGRGADVQVGTHKGVLPAARHALGAQAQPRGLLPGRDAHLGHARR